MPLREFSCPNKHVTEMLLLGADDKKTQYVRCPKCSKRADRIEISQTYMFSDDFFVAKSYERRKKAEPPIHGSASSPDTAPVSKDRKIFV